MILFGTGVSKDDEHKWLVGIKDTQHSKTVVIGVVDTEEEAKEVADAVHNALKSQFEGMEEKRVEGKEAYRDIWSNNNG